MSATAAKIFSLVKESTKDSVEVILERAENRAKESDLAFRGQLTPEEAWILIQQLPKATLVDIRTHEELTFVGRVPTAEEIEWKLFPEMSRNPRFLRDIRNRFNLNDMFFLLCRSGIRSREAAEFLAGEGFSNCFNVLEGFEGDKNDEGQRIIGGWKVCGLPWSQ